MDTNTFTVALVQFTKFTQEIRVNGVMMTFITTNTPEREERARKAWLMTATALADPNSVHHIGLVEEYMRRAELDRIHAPYVPEWLKAANANRLHLREIVVTPHYYSDDSEPDLSGYDECGRAIPF